MKKNIELTIYIKKEITSIITKTSYFSFQSYLTNQLSNKYNVFLI